MRVCPKPDRERTMTTDLREQAIIARHFARLGRKGGSANTPAQQAQRERLIMIRREQARAARRAREERARNEGKT